MKLDLGCGDNKHNNCFGVDIDKNSEADIIWDLNKGIPIGDNQVNEIYCHHILEHLDNLHYIIDEIYRVCRDGAKVHIRVPYYRNRAAYTNPTHQHFFTEKTFDYLFDDRFRWEQNLVTGTTLDSILVKLFPWVFSNLISEIKVEAEVLK